jgi:hypothetical protein
MSRITPSGVHERRTRRAGHQSALIDGMEAVDVLLGTHALDDGRRIDPGRERQLDENAVHVGARVQLVDQGQQLGCGRARRKAVAERRHADRLASLLLAADVDRRGGIVADQDRRQPGCDVARA